MDLYDRKRMHVQLHKLYERALTNLHKTKYMFIVSKLPFNMNCVYNLQSNCIDNRIRLDTDLMIPMKMKIYGPY